MQHWRASSHPSASLPKNQRFMRVEQAFCSSNCSTEHSRISAYRT